MSILVGCGRWSINKTKSKIHVILDGGNSNEIKKEKKKIENARDRSKFKEESSKDLTEKVTLKQSH